MISQAGDEGGLVQVGVSSQTLPAVKEEPAGLASGSRRGGRGEEHQAWLRAVV